MTKTKLVELMDEFKAGLLSKATDGTIDSTYYVQTRNVLMENKSIRDQIPIFIKSCRTADEFREYVRGEFANYNARRKLLRAR